MSNNETTEAKETAAVANPVEELVMFIESLPDSSDYLYFEDNEWWVTNEWLCGSFAGRAFTGDTKKEAVKELYDYFNEHINHESIVGGCVTNSGWPDLNRVKNYIIAEYYEEAE